VTTVAAIAAGVAAVTADRLHDGRPSPDALCGASPGVRGACHVSDLVTTLPSGLTVAIEPMPATRSVSIGVWVGVGARDEPAELSGVSHFLEHLLFKGTPTRSATDISRSIDRVGGDINAFTSKEYTAYYCRVPARRVDDGIDLLGDVLTRPALRPDEFDNERQVILEELAMDDDSPDDVVHRRFARQVFGVHPLGRDTAGERDTVATISVDDVRRFHADHYRAGSTVVAVAGCVEDPARVLDVVERSFASMAPGDGRVPRNEPGTPDGDIDIDDDTEQVHLVVGGRSVPRLDADREALDVVNHVLGGGLSSRLFDEIRERRGLAYSVFSGTAAYADSGAWSVYSGTMPEHAGQVHDLILEQLELLVRDGITDDELEIAVGYLTGSYEMGLEDSGARMSRLGGMLTTLGEVRSVEEQIARWEAVTHDDVRRVIRRVYGAAPPLTVSLGPGYGR
jgi:predicted Zn-dependent peptidase